MTDTQIMILALVLFNVVGNSLALALRKKGYAKAADVVDMVIPIALGLGRAAVEKRNAATRLPPMSVWLMALCLVGCAPSAGARAITTMSEFVSKSDPILRDAYARELEACADKACVERVKTQWAPIVDALQAVRKVWCELEPKAEGC